MDYIVSLIQQQDVNWVNATMRLLLSRNRYYNEILYQKYLSASANRSLPAEDLAWLAEHGAIRVGYLDNYLAYCDLDDASGELVGALREFLGLAENSLYNVTLTFEPVAFSSAIGRRERWTASSPPTTTGTTRSSRRCM